MFETRITKMLGIRYPILAGPMQWLSRAELVAAVSNAGGLGIIASLIFPTPEELKQEIRKTRTLTNKPFAVNVTLLPTVRKVNHEDYFRAALEEGVKIIETSGRSPEPHMKMLKDAGVTVMHRAARTRDLVTAERVGADAVSIVGFEAAGHPGMEDVASLVRIPVAVDAVKIPVIAAGGIADGRGFIAALALGAEGVLMGTRFMASQECPMHPKIKEWITQAQETDTMLIERSIRNAARVMRTPFAERVLAMEQRGATLTELLNFISGERGKNCYLTGDIDGGTIACGQAIGLIGKVRPVKDIIEEIISEAKTISQRLHNLTA